MRTAQEKRLIEAVYRLAKPGPDVEEKAAGVRLNRYNVGAGRETWLQLNGPDGALATVVTYVGYDYHVISVGREHLVLLVAIRVGAEPHTRRCAVTRRKAAA